MLDTIVAVATPPGRGGVGIIRLSGDKAYQIACQISSKKEILPRHVSNTSFYDQTKQLVDTGLLLYFKAPHSFTGEDVVEFQVHGSPIVLDHLIKICIELGARLAKAGEFSERAFLNDKIDLAQAEAIADLIQASSSSAARMAVRSLQGEFSKKINLFNEQLIHLRMYVEAAIDFPEEEIDFLNDGKVLKKLNDLLDDLQIIKNNAQQGVIMREGLTIVIAGKPNAGKSTLINALAQREVAIVTPIAGTTRDVIREHILLDDIPVHLVDTAGLRESEDPVEKEGIERAWKEIREADCLLFVMDATEAQDTSDLKDLVLEAVVDQVPCIEVVNKIDLLNLSCSIDNQRVYVSAKSKNGLMLLINKIKELVGYKPIEGQFLARRRHLEAISKAQELLLTGREQLLQHQAGELLAEDLRLAHLALGEITGEFTSDDLLGQIFSSFCIGK